MDTIFVNPKEVPHNWYLIDAQGKRLGKVAEKAATMLRGKHKPEFAPHQFTGDFIVIINADKVELSGTKAQKKTYYRHSGYPGGMKTMVFEKMLQKKPTFPLEHAIKGMLPKGRLGREMFRKVKIYAGERHPHAAQKPETLEL